METGVRHIGSVTEVLLDAHIQEDNRRFDDVVTALRRLEDRLDRAVISGWTAALAAIGALAAAIVQLVMRLH